MIVSINMLQPQETSLRPAEMLPRHVFQKQAFESTRRRRGAVVRHRDTIDMPECFDQLERQMLLALAVFLPSLELYACFES